jgi:hypothetical protein
MAKRKHRDDIVDGSDDSDEVAEVSMEDMLNKDRAGHSSPSTTNDAATAIAATAPAAAPAAANITADGAADGATDAAVGAAANAAAADDPAADALAVDAPTPAVTAGSTPLSFRLRIIISSRRDFAISGVVKELIRAEDRRLVTKELTAPWLMGMLVPADIAWAFAALRPTALPPPGFHFVHGVMEWFAFQHVRKKGECPKHKIAGKVALSKEPIGFAVDWEDYLRTRIADEECPYDNGWAAAAV